jgi:hypothetical protein
VALQLLVSAKFVSNCCHCCCCCRSGLSKAQLADVALQCRELYSKALKKQGSQASAAAAAATAAAMGGAGDGSGKGWKFWGR